MQQLQEAGPAKHSTFGTDNRCCSLVMRTIDNSLTTVFPKSFLTDPAPLGPMSTTYSHRQDLPTKEVFSAGSSAHHAERPR